MNIISIQEVLENKLRRIKGNKQIERHIGGNVNHIGKISWGCYSCFSRDIIRRNYDLSTTCNANCVYCPGHLKNRVHTTERMLHIKEDLGRGLDRRGDTNKICLSFSGGGEPLTGVDYIKQILAYLNKRAENISKWIYIYTNGMLITADILKELRDLGLDEVRIHLGASSFSKKVYANIEISRNIISTITIETPAWPPHKKKLVEMVKRIDDIGVDHLNIGEIEVNEYNRDRIIGAIPNARLYQYCAVHLYDNGLVYDLMDEACRKRCKYSVLDCNCFVKSIQRSDDTGIIRYPVEDLYEKVPSISVQRCCT